MQHKSTIFSGWVFILFFFFGCSTAKISKSELEAVKTLTPDAGKALIFILRPSQGGYLITFKVKCNGQPMGSLGAMRFIYASLDPGAYKFSSSSENKSELSLLVEAGKTYFIEQEQEMGFVIARSKLTKLDEVAGRKKLSTCKLSGDCSMCKVGS